ncbi:hypothetical protein JCM8097_004403 [Rhodosporidiobolus ruineniae]
MANSSATDASRQQSGNLYKGVKGTSRKDIPPPTGAFAQPQAEPQYYEDKGLRKVRPYMFIFHSWAKERWQNRTLLDIYSEFRDRSDEYYQWAIETGVIVVNNTKSTPDRLIRNGDLISNVMHRHEPPVVAGPIKILYDGRLPGNDGETLVVEKPGSMPVHPTGRYNFNTLLEILKHDYGLPLVHTSNRLDRLTSGVMICALTVEASKKLGAWFGGRRAKDGGVKKEYVARCVGRFPDGEICCEEPLLTVDRQIGVNVVHPEGRPSQTFFTRMSYDEKSNTSVVHCRPITGRSHQIRVHLQYLGHPIANDPIYQNAAAWGETGGKGGVFPGGAERGGSAEDREERRERGERALAAAAAKESEALGGEGAGEGEGAKRQREEMPSRYNKQGELRTDLLPGGHNAHLAPSLSTAAAATPAPSLPSTPAPAAAEGGGGEIDGRAPHDLPLTASAARAIAALRAVKDQDDGFARSRDLEGVELARSSLVGGGNKLSIDAEVASPAEGEGEGAAGEAEEVIESEDGREGGFCRTCFTPLLPDPRPEQLFIWLHAMRYTTLDWDWKSELPYWAEEGYEVPLSSILA